MPRVDYKGYNNSFMPSSDLTSFGYVVGRDRMEMYDRTGLKIAVVHLLIPEMVSSCE